MTSTIKPTQAVLPTAAAGFKSQLPIRTRYDNWIAGEYVAPFRGEYFDNLTPVTGQVLCEVARSTHEDVDKALDAAHAAALSWNTTSPTYRANILNRIADRLEQTDPGDHQLRPSAGLTPLPILRGCATGSGGKPLGDRQRHRGLPLP